MFTKLMNFIFQIIKVITFGKIKTKDQMTSLLGAVIGIVTLILNRAFDVNIPDDMQLAIVGALVSLIFLFWKPKEEESEYKSETFKKEKWVSRE